MTLPCLRCEGTGRALNWFDPPRSAVFAFGQDQRLAYETDLVPRTLSGREILDAPCPDCDGLGAWSLGQVSTGGRFLAYAPAVSPWRLPPPERPAPTREESSL